MSTYVIGDVQGCFPALMALIKKIKFNPAKDKLIFCGDVVNRGGQSLQVLRWIYAHQQNCQVTLGNHDLSLLAQYHVPRLRQTRNKEYQKIFAASDCAILMDWLLQQKLLIKLAKFNTIIVHAGIYPSWSAARAIKEAAFVEQFMTTKTNKFFKHMYGAKPNHWSWQLTGTNRARFAVNSLTRMRYLYKNGGLNFKAKGEIDQVTKLVPWFKFRPRVKKHVTIIFGHWSSLGWYNKKQVVCLDTGKVWGGKLTALKLSKTTIKHKHIYQV
ncbi:MAG: symmetrical bis(5'-nucleosyl)-tetraphosphatase [Proteobacteria bacterium]|nr:symmetrical bis(5'-nucleosyl)-tetraphosphatase [Pseudomonadota bacterium]